jgi:hypothetical protein
MKGQTRVAAIAIAGVAAGTIAPTPPGGPMRRFAAIAALLATLGLCLSAHAAPPGAADEEDELDVEDAAPTSTEQGQTPLDESFGARSHRDWVRETRRQAWADTRWDVHLRSYHFSRDQFDGSESEAWAMGGWVGMKTGYFRERFAFGATAYTSQPIDAPEDKDGTGLLRPGQEGYAVLGELYGEFRLGQDARLSIGRRAVDTPYINRNDSRMTPQTFETVTLQALHAGADGTEWRWGAGWFDTIKERNSEDFVSMAQVAGAPGGVERGVFAAGGNFERDELSIGAINYYSDDILNIFYTESKYAIPLSDAMRLQFALQYSDQASTGDELLTGTRFDAYSWGGKAELAYKGLLLTTAYATAGGDADMRSPWGGYPGYTSVQVEDFNRNGEDAWLGRVAYNFASVPGLSVYGLYVDGSDPRADTAYAKSEYDLNLQWLPPAGTLKGLMVRLRYAHVSHDDPGDTELDDLRLIVSYDPPGL